jgi:histidine triad (HIT) family protein
MATLFTKIIRGELPSYKVYEDEDCFAFLDIRPIRGGHTLIVPRQETDHFTEVPEPAYSAVFKAAQPLGEAIRKATGAPRVGLAVVGFEVPHFHLHLVPIWTPSDLNFQLAKSADAPDLQEMQERIKKALAAL